MTPPEPCIKGRCYAPTACNVFGYCRERSFTPTPKLPRYERRTVPDSINKPWGIFDTFTQSLVEFELFADMRTADQAVMRYNWNYEKSANR